MRPKILSRQGKELLYGESSHQLKQQSDISESLRPCEKGSCCHKGNLTVVCTGYRCYQVSFAVLDVRNCSKEVVLLVWTELLQWGYFAGLFQKWEGYWFGQKNKGAVLQVCTETYNWVVLLVCTETVTRRQAY